MLFDFRMIYNELTTDYSSLYFIKILLYFLFVIALNQSDSIFGVVDEKPWVQRCWTLPIT